MQAFAIDRYKSKEGMRLRDVPEPVLGARDLRVEIRAASVNPIDFKVRDGAFRLFLPYKMPLVLGHDLAGTVVEAGPEVTRFKPGDEIFARPADGRIGTFAERIAIAEDDVALKPKTLGMAEAAALPLVALTAWQALVEEAGLKPGEKVLIQAGSGGVGTIAIQLAKHLGAQVATTTGPANVDWVRKLGADLVIDYRAEDFSKVLSDYDVVLDTQGGATLKKSVGLLRPGGRLIGIAGPPDAAFADRLGLSWPFKLIMGALSRGIRRAADRRRARYTFLFMKPSGAQLAEIATLVDAGALRPIIDRVFPFAQTPEAVAWVERGRAKGKVVVTMGATRT